LNGIQEVSGSIPLSSTNNTKGYRFSVTLFFIPRPPFPSKKLRLNTAKTSRFSLCLPLPQTSPLYTMKS